MCISTVGGNTSPERGRHDMTSWDWVWRLVVIGAALWVLFKMIVPLYKALWTDISQIRKTLEGGE